MGEVKRKEKNGEPLDWELELIAKDSETRKLIFDILTQKNDIESYEKLNQNAENYKDKKDLAFNPPVFQHTESEREKQRAKRKQKQKEKNEKAFLEDEKRWLKREEERAKALKKLNISLSERNKRKKRLIEKDLNYDSDEEAKWIKENFRKYQEHKQIVLKEQEFDEQMRKQENPEKPGGTTNNIVPENQVTDLVLVENEVQVKEPTAKTEIFYKEYVKEDENEDHNKEKITLDFSKNKKVKKSHTFEDDHDYNDPYVKKKVDLKFDEEITKDLELIGKEVNLERKEEQIKKMQKQEIKNLINTNEDSKRLLEIQSQIFSMIPTGREELFNFELDWKIIFKVRITYNNFI
jgi:hypothetical protein